jgi:DUF1009 family protein
MMPDKIYQPARGRLAIIAGGGDFPLDIFHSALQQGFQPRFFALRGFASRNVRNQADTVMVDMLNPSGLIAALRAFAPEAVVLAGFVNRPNPSVLLSAFSALRHQDELKQVIGQGDDHLLTKVIRLIEDHGFPVIGVDQVAPDLLCPEGVLTNTTPDQGALLAIETGFQLLQQLSPFDCGQATVCQGQRVLAIEGPEGTDAMIKRTRPRFSLFSSSSNAPTAKVLIKTAKAGQTRRVDLPAVGPRTIENCRKAGISGLALGAGSVVLIDKQAMIKSANAAGLFIIGMGALHG